MTDRALTLKQERFARAYAGEAMGNATEAARIAGYLGDDNVLGVVGHDNLANPRIAAFLQNLTSEFAASQLAILQETCDIAFAEWREFLEIIDRNGQVLRVKMDLTSKMKALELLAKTQGMLTDKLRVEVVQKALIGINLEDV